MPKLRQYSITHLILIDKVVIKDDWQWVNHATELDMLARVLSMDALRPTT